jgi:hypothetical protein|tara:strand:- start:2467 stop:2832 length:366 start_codon:yes stop_codon:yes gene_type:complete
MKITRRQLRQIIKEQVQQFNKAVVDGNFVSGLENPGAITSTPAGFGDGPPLGQTDVGAGREELRKIYMDRFHGNTELRRDNDPVVRALDAVVENVMGGLDITRPEAFMASVARLEKAARGN